MLHLPAFTAPRRQARQSHDKNGNYHDLRVVFLFRWSSGELGLLGVKPVADANDKLQANQVSCHSSRTTN
jgi:hypothetical protein